ncbi:nuclear transport factor 2 family protein [Sphingomonas sp. TX0543]|uniref:nuclear transport factor 2 family protein n=1 Tax=Sphingomonas sp. TX0543 TaxID=3399682 RepID=UPI003AFAD136
MTVREGTLAVLGAKYEIEQALLRYTRGVDRKDWELVRSAYRADAIDIHGDFNGTIDEFIAYLVKRHENIEQSLHAICNSAFDWKGEDVAIVETYYICYQRLKSADHVEDAFGTVELDDDQTLQITAVGRYIDRFVREDATWLIAHRQVTFDVLKADPTPLGGGLPPTIIHSRRDTDDILWQELKG